MLDRFRLKHSDANFFCFFGNGNGWTVYGLPFGDTCRPFVAIETTRRATTDASATKEIVDAIKNKMYVGDYLGSAMTAAISLKEAIVVKDVLASTDLYLQGRRYNSKEFIEDIRKNMKPTNYSTSSIISEEESGKVLGVV